MFMICSYVYFFKKIVERHKISADTMCPQSYSDCTPTKQDNKMTELARHSDLTSIVAEYRAKVDGVKDNILTFEKAISAINGNSCVAGVYSGIQIMRGHVSAPIEQDMLKSLKASAWRDVYKKLNIERLASANDKSKFNSLFADPPEFNKDNVSSVFKDYLANPRQNILRGVAEVFCGLDQAYKSHEKVKIGVKGLPKRVILNNASAGYGRGRDRLISILNALSVVNNLPLVEYQEINRLQSLEDGLLNPWMHGDKEYPARGVWLKTYANGNGHLYFSPENLRLINLCLAEYYGDVLPDAQERPEDKQTSTAVSKDLQFYKTPEKAADKLVEWACINNDMSILEPSCGDGALIDAIFKTKKRSISVLGIEVDFNRAEQCKRKGYSVVCDNFLDKTPEPRFDRVIMNPPFYGKHYEKHIRHALKFLRSGGRLTSILPSTARYDHGLLDDLNGQWADLEVGSFSESGTNVNTSIFSVVKE